MKMATLTRRCCGFSHFPTRCCNCLKTAEISALFQQCIHLMDFGVGLAVFHQSAVFVWKWLKFRPFSKNVSVWIICPLFRLFQPLFFRGFRKTAKISAIFLQHALIVWKQPKFWPFSYNPECFGRFPTTVFRPFSNNGFRPFSNNGFRPFSYKFSTILLQCLSCNITIASEHNSL